jgi:hypothetical protein
MSDYTEFLRQKIKMASFKGFEVTPEISRRRSALIDLLYDTRKNT